jgi:hypothetical protein
LACAAWPAKRIKPAKATRKERIYFLASRPGVAPPLSVPRNQYARNRVVVPEAMRGAPSFV